MTIRILALCAILAALAACAAETQYPVSGEECAPGDPVQEIDATFCPPSAPGGF